MSRKRNSATNRSFKDEMKQREHLAELIMKDCNVGLRYLTWANTPSKDLQAFYDENKLKPGETREYEEY